MKPFDEVLDHLTQNYRDAEYIELEVRYKFLLEEVMKAEKAFKDDWVQNCKCGCIFDYYRESCDHMKKARNKDKELKDNKNLLWDISMKMFHKTNNGLYFLTAEQFKIK